LITWFLLGSVAFRELYSDIETYGTWKRVNNYISGKCRWICIAVITLETLVTLKYTKDAGNMSDDWSTPAYIWVPWFIFFASGFAFYLYLRFKPDHTTIYPKEYYE
jgi:hypothetical protein